jgi:hypothetical protein
MLCFLDNRQRRRHQKRRRRRQQPQDMKLRMVDFRYQSKINS